MSAPEGSQLPLQGLKVVDSATLFAGPVIGVLMGDFGANVIKVEHPRGDALRGLGWSKDGVSLWWAHVGRNKRCVTLTLSKPKGRDLMLRLLSDADVYIENFRPGTLERYGLGLQEHERWSTMSMVKSMTAMLVGAAVRDGALSSIDEPATRHLPELRDSAYEGVTLRHLMTMSSGGTTDRCDRDFAYFLRRHHAIGSIVPPAPGSITPP